MSSTAETLVAYLRALGVEVVFGIPGVHTIELYRGLPASGIRHVTARHEQGAGFMADGYARVSGRPGVAFVITGPGVTNILTPMAQARADSVPMLVVSSVNARATLGRQMGHLHELPDQQGLVGTLALTTEHIDTPEALAPAIGRVFGRLKAGRGGPVHLQVPTDVAPLPAADDDAPRPAATAPDPEPAALRRAAARLDKATRPLLLAGGGAKRAEPALRSLAEALDAPVVLTANARGLLHGHPLSVPASPSLQAVRELIADADSVLAVGTEFGPTDYDMYETGTLPVPADMTRIDVCPEQLARHPAALGIVGDAGAALAAIAGDTAPRPPGAGAERARAARDAARAEIGPAMHRDLEMLEALRDALPGAVIVGDSTQPVYAGNLFFDHDRPGGWFNSATGYGALGYATGAAVGAALAAPGAPVVCLVGDGGLMFSAGELMTAVDEALPITFVVWNNHGFGEIASAMRGAGAQVIGCDPQPPAMRELASACGLPFQSIAPDPAALTAALGQAADGPRMIEVAAG